MLYVISGLFASGKHSICQALSVSTGIPIIKPIVKVYDTEPLFDSMVLDGDSYNRMCSIGIYKEFHCEYFSYLVPVNALYNGVFLMAALPCMLKQLENYVTVLWIDTDANLRLLRAILKESHAADQNITRMIKIFLVDDQLNNSVIEKDQFYVFDNNKSCLLHCVHDIKQFISEKGDV